TPSRSSGASPPASTSGTGASSTAPRPAAPPASTTPTDQPSICPHLPPNGDAMTDLDIIDAEIVPTATDLDASMSRVEASVSSIADELVWQLTSEAWRADGRYSSFSDLWADRWEPLG